MKRKTITGINSGSMADIAFLLLVFFLVTTTIDIDSGLLKRLPHYVEETPQTPVVKERNILEVLVNANNEIMVEGNLTAVSDLRNKTIEFLTNPTNSSTLPEFKETNIAPFGEIRVTKGIISLQNDNGTNYATYLSVMNELTAAGNVVKNKYSLQQFNVGYSELDDAGKNAINQAKPFVLSEAEPVEL